MEKYLKEHLKAEKILEAIEIVNIQIAEIKDCIKRNKRSDGKPIMSKLLENQKDRRQRLYKKKSTLKAEYKKQTDKISQML